MYTGLVFFSVALLLATNKALIWSCSDHITQCTSYSTNNQNQITVHPYPKNSFLHV